MSIRGLSKTKYRFVGHCVMDCGMKTKTIYGFRSKVVYYESRKRELKIRGIYECRCDERLQTKTKRFTLPYTGSNVVYYNGESES